MLFLSEYCNLLIVALLPLQYLFYTPIQVKLTLRLF